MNPLRLTARKYRSFETLDLEFPTGAVAIVGPNGAGKSSLVNAIDLALFGARSLSEFLSDDAGDEEMVLALEFEHREHHYRIRRTFSPRGRGKTTLDFEEGDGGRSESGGWLLSSDWRPLTLESAAATQSRIEDTIGLSRETFRASAFLAQGEGDAFTSAAPRDRKAILQSVLGLGIWDDLYAINHAAMTTIRDTTTRLRIQVEEADRDLERKPAEETMVADFGREVGALELTLREAESVHIQATEKLNASREQAAKLTAAREVLASRERELAAATTRKRQIDQALEGAEGLPKLRAESEALAGRRESIESDIAAAREGEKAREEHRRLLNERDRFEQEASELTERVAVLRRDAETALARRGDETQLCPTCEQTLGYEAAGITATKLHAQADELETEAKQKLAAADNLLPALAVAQERMVDAPNAAKQAELEAALRVSIEAERTLATIAEREKTVEGLNLERVGLTGQLPALTVARDAAGVAVEELTAGAPTEDLEAAVARAYGVLHEARNDAEGAKSRLAVAQAELKRLTDLETRTKENRAALAGHRAELERLALCEQAYGRNGIPVFILENVAIPFLENEVNAIVAELGTPYHVELLTQKEKKSGDGLKEELYIQVDGREYRTYSGGERSRINLAFSRALARLLRSRGVEIDLLVMDEPDGLDAAGFAALAESLKGALADFERVLVISHHPDLATAFDQTLTVEKEDGRSRVVGAQVAEAVVAA